MQKPTMKGFEEKTLKTLQEGTQNLESNFVPNDEVLDEKVINKILVRLIDGQTCQVDIKPPISALRSNVVYVTDKSVLDANYGGKDKQILFEGNILVGGIYDEKNNFFISDDRQFAYELQDDLLLVSSICTKQKFTIKCFDAKEKNFGIRLSKNPLKEIAVVLEASKKVQDYITALQQIAPQLSRHFFKTQSKEEYYVKLVMVSFANLNIETFGAFYEAKDFVEATKKLKIRDTNTRMVYYSLINAMSYFTKDNHLAKEIYLFTGGSFADPQNEAKALSITKNINQNATFNSEENELNAVKIHTFALGKDLDFLKNIAKLTGGTYHFVNNSYGLQKDVLTLANDGVFDPSDLKGEIIPAKTHKMYDPDNPDNAGFTGKI